MVAALGPRRRDSFYRRGCINCASQQHRNRRLVEQPWRDIQYTPIIHHPSNASRRDCCSGLIEVAVVLAASLMACLSFDYRSWAVPMSSRMRNTISDLGLGWGLHCGDLNDKASYVHHALKICIAHDSNFMVDLGESTIWTSAVLVRSGIRHALRNDEGMTCSLYIDPDCEAAAGLVKLSGSTGVISLSGPVERAARKCVRLIVASGVGAQTAFEEFSTVLGSPRTGRICDPRVSVALAALIDGHHNRRPLAGLAQTAGLSPQRFATVFRESTGLPVRTYVRWLRIQTAIGAIARGSDLTSATKMAGYSSEKQFANYFRHFFGVSPSAFATTLRNRR